MTIVYTLLHSATSEEKETKMQSSEIELVYFSATGTTRKIIQTIGKTLPIPKNDRNLLLNPIRNDISMAADHLTVVAMPVYNGRLPDYCTQSLMHLKGNGTPAIAVVVYGNRDYDDALLELKTLLEKNGFIVLGAAAFIARHSIFPQVATDRPDENDLALVKDFTNRCIEKLTSSSTVSDFKPFEVKGNFPYKEARSVPMKPSSGEDCNVCGTCAQICPVHAITVSDTKTQTDENLCISCGACITACPSESRQYRGEDYEKFKGKFIERFSRRKEPEWFL